MGKFPGNGEEFNNGFRDRSGTAFVIARFATSMVAMVITRLTTYMNTMIVTRLTADMNTVIVPGLTACMDTVIVARLCMIAMVTRRMPSTALAGMPLAMTTAAMA